MFQAEVSSFRLNLAAEGKAAKTVRAYTEAVQWFAAAHLLRETSRTSWDQVDRQDVQRWMVRLLGRYSDAYASNPDPDDQLRSDVDLWQREVTVRGKGGKARVVRIGHEAARSLDRCIRVRSRHRQAHRAELWLGPATGRR